MGRGSKLLALSWRERWFLWQAWWALLIADLALRLLPSARVIGWVDRRLRRVGEQVSSPTVHQGSDLVDYDRLVRVAARHHLYAMSCLQRSLTLGILLARRGIQCRLLVGARKIDSSLDAHAWIEHAGRPVGEPADISQIYSPLTPGVTQR